jgi:DNA-binding transcriptional MocR family regulator
MSRHRRNALVEFARTRGAVIVEDDYDGEFRFDGAPLEALRSSEFADVVFYVGTFSKCMLRAVPLGFVAAPDWAIPALITVKNSTDARLGRRVRLHCRGPPGSSYPQDASNLQETPSTIAGQA